MSDRSDWTCVLSGPVAQRGPLLSGLAQTGANIDEQPARNPSHGLPADDPTVGWVTVRHPDIDTVAAHAAQAGWSLRSHWPTPPCRVCAGVGQTNIGTVGLGTCLHCAGTGRTNTPPPAGPSVADLLARIETLEARA